MKAVQPGVGIGARPKHMSTSNAGLVEVPPEFIGSKSLSVSSMPKRCGGLSGSRCSGISCYAGLQRRSSENRAAMPRTASDAAPKPFYMADFYKYFKALASYAGPAYHHCPDVCSKITSNPYFLVIGCCDAASPSFRLPPAGTQFRAPPARRRASQQGSRLAPRSYVSQT